MIAKGNPHNSGPYLARYLAASSKGNENAELAELRGFASDNVFDAFALAQLQADGTHCQKPLFHVQVRTPQGEELTRDQWGHVTERIEKHLGFSGQPRAVVFHQKDGHKHMHLVWSRIDADTMTAIDPGLYKRKLKEICRKLEKEMDLQQVRNERDSSEKTQPPARPEYEQSRRLKTDVKAIRETIRDCWDMSANGVAFAAALEKEGLVLAKGDKRAFVIVDKEGGYHALGKKITGVTAQKTRAKLEDIKAEQLPTVERAQGIQRERRDREEAAMSERGEKKTDEERWNEAVKREEERRGDVLKEEEERRTRVLSEEKEREELALAEEEKWREAGSREEERRREAFKAQAERQVEQAREMQAQEQQLAAYKEELVRRAEEARREEERRRQAESRARELEIRNAGSRYGQALAQHYDMKDPYGSLARAAMGEYGAFLRDREALDRKIARANDPKEREALELQKRIEAAEYMAITSNRIAIQSEIIVGRNNTEEAKRQRARAAEYQKEATELRGRFRELQATRFPDRDVPQQEAVREPEQKQEIPAPEKESGPSLMVQERQRGKQHGEPQKLVDFVKELPDEPERNQRPLSQAELRSNPAARRAHYAQLIAEQQRGPALDRMGEDMRAGRALSADDVRKLSQADKQKIKERGERYLKELAEQRQQERERAPYRER